jgi:hypothetical protein
MFAEELEMVEDLINFHIARLHKTSQQSRRSWGLDAVVAASKYQL